MTTGRSNILCMHQAFFVYVCTASCFRFLLAIIQAPVHWTIETKIYCSIVLRLSRAIQAPTRLPWIPSCGGNCCRRGRGCRRGRCWTFFCQHVANVWRMTTARGNILCMHLATVSAVFTACRFGYLLAIIQALFNWGLDTKTYCSIALIISRAIQAPTKLPSCWDNCCRRCRSFTLFQQHVASVWWMTTARSNILCMHIAMISPAVFTACCFGYLLAIIQALVWKDPETKPYLSRVLIISRAIQTPTKLPWIPSSGGNCCRRGRSWTWLFFCCWWSMASLQQPQ